MHLDVRALHEQDNALSVLPMGDLLTSHGGLATNYVVEAVKWHTIDEFKTDIVPTLYSTAAEGPFSYFIIRDLSRGRLLSVAPDGVTELRVSSVEDFPATDVITSFKRNMDRYGSNNSSGTVKAAHTLNTSVPVFDYAEYFDDSWAMTIKVPETRIQFQHNNSDLSLPIYFPPCLYTLRMSANSVYIKSRIALLVQDSISTNFMRLGKLPMPNVSGTGDICIGNVTLNAATEEGRTRTKTELVTMALDMFLNSRWNLDYMGGRDIPSNTDTVIAELLDETGTEKSAYPELNVLNATELKLGKLLFVFRHAGAWERLNFEPFDIEGFLGHEIRS